MVAQNVHVVKAGGEESLWGPGAAVHHLHYGYSTTIDYSCSSS